MKNIPVKYKDESLDIKENWKIFCRKLYSNVLKLEQETIKKDAQMRNAGQTFSQRRPFKEKLKRCERYKKIIKDSASKKEFVLQHGDDEIILNKGWDYYFTNFEGELIYD